MQWADSVISSRRTAEENAKPIPAVPINFRNAALIKLLEAEPPSVQAEVEVWRQAQQQADELKDEEDLDEEALRLQKANIYHK